MPRFRLRYQNNDLEVPVGEFVVGRSTDCQLSVDDPLVSRRHASFVATEEALSVEDLGSRNGIRVNRTRAVGRVELHHGDIVGIGNQDLLVVVHQVEIPNPERRRAAVTMNSEAEPGLGALGLLVGLVEKAMAMGRHEEAERILSNLLADIQARLQRAGLTDPGMLQEASKLALKVAAETNKTSLLDWIFTTHRIANRVLPALTVDELYTVARKIKYPVSPPFRDYIEHLRAQAEHLSPTERFALQRIEGLTRVLLAQ